MRERSQLSKSRLYRGIPRIHMLYYLLYILQDPGKNEFRIKNGPYVAVDLDRAGFIFHRKPVDAGFGYAWIFHSKASASRWGMMANLLQRALCRSVCLMCRFDRTTVDTIATLADNNLLGRLTAQSIYTYERDVLFSFADASLLDTRVRALRSCIKSCIKDIGAPTAVYRSDPPLPESFWPSEVGEFFVVNTETFVGRGWVGNLKTNGNTWA